MLLPLEKLRCDGGTQPREKIDVLLVKDYQEAYKNGDKFPPVVVFYDGKDYWLADGFHRVTAIPAIGATSIEAEVRQGTREDAVWFSCGVNSTHGQPRTNEDKERAVKTALSHNNHKSNSLTAKHCGVSHTLVNSMASRLESVSSQQDTEKTRIGKDGRKTRPASDSRKAGQKERREREAEAKKPKAESKQEPKAAESKPSTATRVTKQEEPHDVAYDHVVHLAQRLPLEQQRSLHRLIGQWLSVSVAA